MDLSKKRLVLKSVALGIAVFFVTVTLVEAAQQARSFTVHKVDDSGDAVRSSDDSGKTPEKDDDTQDVSEGKSEAPEKSGVSEKAAGQDSQDDSGPLEKLSQEVKAVFSSDSDAVSTTQPTDVSQKTTEDGIGPVHRGVTATLFWAGEEAGDDNGDISNLPSAWDEKWVKNFGGVDDPKKRSGYFPAKFTPKENPFYFALPYNDFDSKGKRRADAEKLIPWAKEKEWKDDESICKNQWVKVMKGDKVAYAQWEDVGPFGENDASYVFGSGSPKSKTNDHAGIDLSPAVNKYLDLSDVEQVDWQFVSADQVPDGPWKKIVTDSQVNWN